MSPLPAFVTPPARPRPFDTFHKRRALHVRSRAASCGLCRVSRKISRARSGLIVRTLRMLAGMQSHTNNEIGPSPFQLR